MNERARWVARGVLVSILGIIIFRAIWVNATSMNFGVICLIVVAVVLFFAGLFMVVNSEPLAAIKIEEKNEKEKKEKAEREKEEKNRKVAEGTWAFPGEEFYARCKKEGFTALDSSFYETKAKAIADELMRSNEVDPKYFYLYDTKVKMEEYLAKGREKDAEEQAREEEKKRHPQPVKLTEQQRKTFDFNSSLQGKAGKDKREAMLDKAIADHNTAIREKYEAKRAMETLGYAIASSASQTKTTSWATTAGIANGLAGPVAGVLAGAEAMQRNAQIEEQNRRNRAAVNQMAGSVYNSASSLNGMIDELKKKVEILENAKKDLAVKVVIDGTDRDVLFQSLEISGTEVKEIVNQEKNHALRVSMRLKSDYRPKDVPETVSVTIDGTLQADVMAGDLSLGSVCIPLPLYGVVCGDSVAVEAETIFNYYAINGKPYSLSNIRPNYLWLMEV